MTTLVIMVLGDDRPGLVATLSDVVARYNASWDRSQLARIAGKFAGIVQVEASDEAADALVADLEAISSTGILQLTVERVAQPTGPQLGGYRARLSLTGQDHPGLLHEVAAVFARLDISIEELETDTGPAPMGGFMLFGATASLFVPDGVSPKVLESALEEISLDLMVEVEFD